MSERSQPSPAELVLAGRLTGARWTLAKPARIGRAPSNEVVLTGDPSVSKEHALVQWEDGRWRIHDLESANGTFVNGQRVAHADLKDGDRVTIGQSELVFKLIAEQSREPAPAQAGPSPGKEIRLPERTVMIPAPVDDAASFRPAQEMKDLDRLRRDYEKLRIAHAFNRALREARGAREVCRKVLDVAFDTLPAESGAMLLRNRSTGRLETAAVKKREGAGEVHVSETLIERAVRTREGVLTANALVDSRFNASRSVIMQGLRSAMAVPLVGSTTPGEVRGVLFLETRDQVGAFEEKDLLLFAAIGAQASYVLENAELSEAREQMARFLPPPLVEQAARGAISIDPSGSHGEGTILFADLRNFTSMAERLSAPATVALLNQFFEGMVEEVFAENGVLDKFLGDGLMAFFGMPVHQENAGAGAALRCALRMQARMGDLNLRRTGAGEIPLAMGIGIDTGTVVVGSMGCARRMEYTAIGDAVNVASRICAVARPGEVLCGAATAEQAGSSFGLEAMPPQRLKGKERPVPVYRVTARD